jgi:DNA repair protein RadA/Sms
MAIVKSREPKAPRLSSFTTSKRGRFKLRDDWDEVLGEGFLEGTIVLVSGKPGAGKSTDCLDLAARAGTFEKPTLYLTSEWDPELVASRARELGLDLDRVVCERVTSLEDVTEELYASRARLSVIDSWGALNLGHDALDTLRRAMGMQTVLAILHATKDGDFAGDEKLLHKADALIWVDPHELTCRKNWHGPPELVVKRHVPYIRDSA